MTECKFKVGDKVENNRTLSINPVPVGTVLTIYKIENGFIYARNNRYDCTGWYPRSFELVTPASKFEIGKEYRGNFTKTRYRCIAIGEFPILKSNGGPLLEVKTPDNWTEVVPEKYKVLLSLNSQDNGYDVEITQETFDSEVEAEAKWKDNPKFIRVVKTTR